MSSELSDTASTCYEKKQEIRSKREELSGLRSEVLGTDSPEVERKARSLFSDAGVDSGGGRLEEIDELSDEVGTLETELSELERAFRNELAEIRLPFSETIEHREDDEEVAFPFSDPIPDAVVRGIDEVIPREAEAAEVELRTDEIVAFTDDIGDAIAEVETFVTDIRQVAGDAPESEAGGEGTGSYSIFG